ncbi:restriction endonuclease subunit S [Pseudomonas chlororaphis]|uniref:restriction endonuclease subunit S n=1 Tax=Pseudomonas chlororaphis TaxID=587753 RepID=UPI001B31104E|nr:restriction endonuclease subunit S [Pseudomonas chlororaphis]QTT91023.1 restriction endonuclease subunit S [Pseudomonas chlororaphis]
MTAFLTDNLPLLAAAPNGIKKLRELILELAVRGKLVPQEPSDAPASELLKRIAEEKAQLVAEGKIKKTKLLEEIAAEKWPFILPAGWEWSRLGDVSVYIQRGKGPVYIDQSDFKVVSQKCVRWTGLDLQPARFIAPESLVKYEATRFLRSGDILWNSTGTGTIGRACVVENCSEDEQLVADSHVTVVRPAGLLPVFLLRWIQSPSVQSEIEGNASGTTNQIELNTSTVIAHLTPVPPLAEQLRIVAKVDELMALCDRLEAQQADAESAHAQLVQALLDSLNQASDATDFAANWQRLAEHFHTLFATETSIDALKQTLLQLAVMGKLVPQDPSDEPASELLKRIAEEKERLFANGDLKRQKSAADAANLNMVDNLPNGWKFVSLSCVSTLITDGTHQTPKYVSSGRPFLSAQNVKPFKFMPDNHRFVSPEDFDSLRKNRTPELGDILMTRVGAMIGEAAVIDQKIDFAFYVSLALIKLPKELCSAKFIVLWLNSPLGTALSIKNTLGRGVSAGNLNLGLIRNFHFGLPPLAEQHRIVAKVDQLMALCDQLKISLTRARQLNEQLASTLVERALAEDGQQIFLVTDRQAARTLLAAEITHRLHSQRTFGQRKLQKVIYLAEHAARLAAIQGDYLRDAAGPHDRQLMNTVEGKLQTQQWYERVERETVGHAYRPLSQAGQHRQAYSSVWSVAERVTIEQVIELMRDWDTDRCEMTVTLYAAWNDFILEGRPISDEAIMDEVMHSWNDTKLRFGKTEWLAVLAEMKKHKILMPTGFGKRTKGGMLSLPGFE